MKLNLVQGRTDEELLELIRNSDNSAFNELYDRYWKLVYNTAYKQIKDVPSAQDITQDIFTKLWLRDKDDKIENLKAYFFTAVRNKAYKLMVKQGRCSPISDLLTETEVSCDHTDGELLFKEFVRSYEALINNLPDQQRIIFRKRYHENLNTLEISDQLCLSPKTVRNHLGRALARLKTVLTMTLLLLMCS
ncbi:RNA polymerase sigma factor [Pedobacter nyackensis]|uniref:RNA polymerase sigma factor n=1 Tax=Pedobacter nyackensis TaxID=475255 RepID=UPI0029311192|nr:sigma-70 family RNA polymerase sigma factor [Pedobacter nyackensis]